MKWVLRIFYPSYGIEDSTSGFVAWRRDILEKVLQYRVPGDGYAFQTSMKLIAFRLNYPAIEIPIIFRDRRLGVSKLNRHIIFEAWTMPWRLGKKIDLIQSPQVPDGQSDTETVGFLNQIKSVSSKHWFKQMVWWLGAPVLFVLALFGYMVYPRLVYHLQPWWRFPVATPGIFDSYLYYFWGGAVGQGIPLGEWLHWLRPILHLAWSAYGHLLSVPEFILSTQLVTGIAFIWVMPWVIRQWSQVTIAQSRWLTLAFTLAWTCTYGFRPGVYSWYAPFVSVGIGMLPRLVSAIEKQTWKSVIGLGAAALFLTSLYPWYQVFTIVYITVLVALAVFRKRLSFFYGLILVAIGLSIGVSYLAAHIMVQPSFQATIDQYARTGVVFVHLPYLANTVIAMVGWCLLLCLAPIRFSESVQRWFVLFCAWATHVAVWFDYPFTGVYIYNDHFMMTAALLSICSVGAFLFDATRSDPLSKRARCVAYGLMYIAGVATTYYTFLSLRAGSPLSYLNHLVIWIPFLAATVCVNFPHIRPRIAKAFCLSFFALGVWGYGSLLHSQLPFYPKARMVQPVSEWIRNDGLATTAYCSDIDTSMVLAAHTGRRFYPSEGTIHVKETDEVFFKRFQVISSVFDVRAAGELPMWDYYVTYGSLDVYRLFFYQIRFLRWLGVSETRIAGLAGDQSHMIQERKQYLHGLMGRSLTGSSLHDVCQRVVVKNSLASFWHLPLGAILLFQDSNFRVYESP